MTATDEVNFDAEPPKSAKRKAKARRAAPAPKRAKPTVLFPGLTRSACADGCDKNGCVVSGKPYCAHPTKGGLQAADLNDPKALKRLQQAREQLAVRVDPDRFT